MSIINGRIVTPEGLFEGCIEINEGKIAGISILPANKAARVINAENLLIFPGFIDAHVHFLEPLGREKETFQSGTKAAALGGITTVFEMPGIEPAVISTKALDEKKRIAASEAAIDYALFGGAGMNNLKEIAQLAEGGVIGFKTFMTAESAYRARTDSELLQIFEEVSRTGLRSAVHAELGDLVETLIRCFQAKDNNSPEDHTKSRPSMVEYLAINRVIEIARFVGAKAHIVHMSTKEGCQLVRDAKKARYDITAETCPHYLLLTEDDIRKLGPYAKINPPLRKKEDQISLWEGLKDGTIDIIASDHAPCSREEKEIGWKDIWRAGAGNPGLETMVGLIVSRVKQGLSLPILVNNMIASMHRIGHSYAGTFPFGKRCQNFQSWLGKIRSAFLCNLAYACISSGRFQKYPTGQSFSKL